MASTSTLPGSPKVGAGPDAASTSASATPQLPIVLTTRLATLSIPQQPYLVPVDWRRSQLSTLVNRLLSPSQPIPFDFIVDGELLRTDLRTYLAQRGKSTESTLRIEYVRSTLPPRIQAQFQHPDWISDVDLSRKSFFLTATYDGCFRVLGSSTASEPLVTHARKATSAAAPSPLTSARWLSVDGPDGQGSASVATTSMDGTLCVYRLPEAWDALSPDALNAGSNATGATGVAKMATPTLVSASTAYASPTRHAMSRLCVGDARVGSDVVATAGWDGAVSVWSRNKLLEPSSPADDDDDDNFRGTTHPTKKQRRDASAASKVSARRGDAGPSSLSVTPRHVFWHVPPPASLGGVETGPVPAANARVDGLALAPGDAAFAYSAGWDGVVREWDLDAMAASTVKTTTLQHLCLTHLGGGGDGANASAATSVSRHVLLTGSVSRQISVLDLRSNEVQQVAVAMPAAHAGAVSCVSSHPSSQHLFASAGYDGEAKLWDVRSAKSALFSLQQQHDAATASTTAAKGARGDKARHEQKLLALAWEPSEGQTVAAGGEEGLLRVYRGEGIGVDEAGAS